MIQDIFKLIYSLLGLVLLMLIFLGVLLLMLVKPDLFYRPFSEPQLAALETEGVQETAQPEGPVWQVKNPMSDLPDDELITYGFQLISETDKHLGEEALQGRAYVGNDLTCKNCHLDAGTKAFAGSYVGVVNRYPKMRGREGRIASLEDRINGCMERSMDGKPLSNDSREMKAMIAYMNWLSEDVPEETAQAFQGFVKIEIPERAVDLVQGKQLYMEKCSVCHGEEGVGQQNPDQTAYIYPPLWGDESYNHGAGMNRVLTAAAFIKGNMPLGASYENPLLTDEEAYDIAGYINSHTRPMKEGVEKDYPDLSKKPIDSPYGPYADDFPQEQHKFGPFQPIASYYQNLKEN